MGRVSLRGVLPAVLEATAWEETVGLSPLPAGAALPLPPPTWNGGCCSEYRRHQHWSWLGKLKQCLVEGLGDCQVPYIFLLPRSEKCLLLGLRRSSWQVGGSTHVDVGS